MYSKQFLIYQIMIQNLSHNESTFKPQIPQIQCIYHLGHTIHNFCQDQQCLLPMCSICIGIHAIEHQQTNSFPSFCSLQEVVNDTRSKLVSACQQLELFSQQYTNDYLNKQKMQEQCRKKLQILKNKIIREVQNSFAIIQSQISSEILKFDQKIHQKYQQLQHQIQYLYQSLQLQLNSLEKPDQLLKQVIKFRSEQRKQQIDGWLYRFQQRIVSLQKQSIKVAIRGNILDFAQKLPQEIVVEQFTDTQNNLLQASSRGLLNSDRIFKQTQ